MKTKFNGFLTLFLALFVQITFAQEKTISGVVSDSTGPLPGVSVLKKGTVQGTETDFDGKYVIKAKTGDTLVFSFVGMETVEKVVGNSNTFSVVLKEGNVLEEVVVVGYGTTTKKSFTGTAKVVDSKSIEAKSVSNVSQALTGEVSGVTVVRSNGRPGADSKVRIRGFGSLNGNSAPLYVVDGVPFLGKQNSINPADIESTVVLKDATATAIYGSRGANGVIVITTKTGKSGKTVFDLDVKTTVNWRGLPVYDLVNNEEEYLGLSYNALKNTAEANGKANPTDYALTNLFGGKGGIGAIYNMWEGSAADIIDIQNGVVKKGVKRKYTPEDWKDYGYKKGIRTETNFKMSGGNEKSKHYFSLGYLDDQGYISKSSYERYSTKFNLSLKPLDWLKVNTGVAYTYGINNNATGYGGGNVTYMLDYVPTIFPLFMRDEDGKVIINKNTKSPAYDFGLSGRAFSATYNGVGEAVLNTSQGRRHSVNGNFRAVATLGKGFTFETSFSANIFSNTFDRYRNPFQGSAGPAKNGTLDKEQTLFMATNFNQILKYKANLGDLHNLDLLAAHESNEQKQEFFNLSKNGVINLNPKATVLPSNFLEQNNNSNGYIEDAATESYFAQANYNYGSKYYLTGTIRRDGTSRFYKNKWGNFWSVGSAWVVSEEDFLNSSDVVNFLKLKVSYGVLGDQGSRSIFYYGQGGFDMANLLGNTSLIPRAVVDPNITWETSNQFQAGVEASLFNDRVDVSVDYYKKKTSNLFVNKRLSPSTGDAVIRTNDGELENSGIEFDVTGHIVKNDNFKLSLGINGEMLSNKITKMPIENATGKAKTINVVDYYGRALNRSIYDFYVREWKGVDSSNGNPQWTQNWEDKNGNKAYDEGEGIDDLANYMAQNKGADVKERLTSDYSKATLKFINKKVIPKVRGAFRLNTSYSNFYLSAQFGYSLGGYGYDAVYSNLMSNSAIGSSSYHTDIRKSWKKPGDKVDVPRLYSNFNTEVSRTSSRFITKTDYLSLNNVSLGYSLPKDFIENSGFSSVGFSVSADNLFLLTKRRGYNPSTSLKGESGSYTYNPISSFTLGVRVKF